jgi:hypothetical protein
VAEDSVGIIHKVIHQLAAVEPPIVVLQAATQSFYDESTNGQVQPEVWSMVCSTLSKTQQCRLIPGAGVITGSCQSLEATAASWLL